MRPGLIKDGGYLWILPPSQSQSRECGCLHETGGWIRENIQQCLTKVAALLIGPNGGAPDGDGAGVVEGIISVRVSERED